MEEASVHAVSCGLLVCAGRVLLMHRSPWKQWYPDVWDLPGGHREPGENGRQALVRELREELNVQIALPTKNPILLRQDGEMFLEAWLIEEWDGTVVNAAPGEHDAFGWFSLDEAIALDLASNEYKALFKQILS